MSESSILNKNIFLNKSIEEIHACYRDGTLDPAELAQICIDRVTELEGRCHAWVCFDKEILLKQADEIKRRLQKGEAIRLLEGIPMGIKDIINTKELPTQMGSPIWKDFTPGNDARVVYNVRNAGGMIPGKTVTAEFAVHTLGETLNPHDVTRTPGTSSSGSAVAVALGMVPVALGTQTAGSIVRPASFCGVYGCKPSFGTIPRTGMLKTTDSLDTFGFFTSRFRDLARVFDVLKVHGPDYPLSYHAFNDKLRQNKPEGRHWKVAFVRTHTWNYAYNYAKDAIVSWARKLSDARDIEIVETDLPSEMEHAHEIHATIYDKTLSYYFKEEYKKAELVSPIMNEIIRRGNELSVKQYLKALKEQEKLCHIMDNFMQQFDALISLSTAGEAPLREDTEKPDPALMWTMTHLPSISAPVFTSPGGLPFGVQLVARKYNDLLLFKFSSYLRSMDILPAGVNPLVSGLSA